MSGMNRKAILLYLKNLIDLETAKIMLPKAAQKEFDDIKQRKLVIEYKCRDLISAHTTYNKQHSFTPGEEPTFTFSPSNSSILSIVVGIIFVAVAVALLVEPMTKGYIPVDPSQRLLADFSGGLVSIMIAIVIFIKPIKEYNWQKKGYKMKWDAWKSRSSPEYIKERNKELEEERLREEEIKENNKIIFQNRDDELRKLKNHQKQREAYFQSELNRIDSILKDFWNMNIIPNRYRNLPSIIWIYDWMSSSQETLESTLMHAHIEEGIQRIEKKMDQIIDKIEESIRETRLLNERTSSIISQNQSMLASLERTERNTSIAAEYSQLSANYNKANA